MDFDRLQNVIQSLCDKEGIKVRTAYEKSGVGRSFYDNIRKGSVPSVEKLQALAKYFGVSLDYLVGNTDYPYTATTNKAMRLNLNTPAVELSDREIAVALAYRNHPVEQTSIDRILEINWDDQETLSIAAKGGHVETVANKSEMDSATSEALAELNKQIKKKY